MDRTDKTGNFRTYVTMNNIWNILISKLSWIFPLGGSGTIITLFCNINTLHVCAIYNLLKTFNNEKGAKGTNNKYGYAFHLLLYTKCEVFVNIHV